MADQTSFQPDGVRRVAGELTEIDNDGAAALRRLKTVLDEHDGAWGKDEFGKGFAKKYTKPAKDCVDGATVTIDNIGKAADGLRKALTKLQDSDTHNAVWLRLADKQPGKPSG